MRPAPKARTLRLLPLLLLAASACKAEDQRQASGSTSASSKASETVGRERPNPPPPQAKKVEAPPPREPETPAEEQLQAQLAKLGSAFKGDVGIAVRDIDAGWTAHFRGAEQFPQQSVSKLWVAITVLDQVDRGVLDLSEEVVIRRDDLTLFYQPIRGLVLRDGEYRTTLGDLLVRALTRSDNTANDFLMWKAGGPEAVRRTLDEKNISGVRFGPGERLLQSKIAGVTWKPEYSIGRAFFQAREDVPAEQREAAFEEYLKDPIDGATPIAIADALARLKKGELLSSASTERLVSIMEQTRSGPRRLKGGLAPGWSISHKTGTGQIYRGAQAGYNDVGLLTSPSGRAYSVAVMIGRTSQPLPERMQLMQNAVRAVTKYHERVARDE